MSATSCCAVVALVSLWLRRFRVARIAAIAEVTLILAGWSLAQYPRPTRRSGATLCDRLREGEETFALIGAS